MNTKIKWSIIGLIFIVCIYSIFMAYEKHQAFKEAPVQTMQAEIEKKSAYKSGGSNSSHYKYYLKIEGEKYTTKRAIWKKAKKGEFYKVQYKEVYVKTLLRTKKFTKVIEIEEF